MTTFAADHPFLAAGLCYVFLIGLMVLTLWRHGRNAFDCPQCASLGYSRREAAAVHAQEREDH